MSYINILSKISNSVTTRSRPMQPKYPLKQDSRFGFYGAITSTEESLNQDFKFLLLTEPGSWPMNPDLGIGLKKYLFENYSSESLSNIGSIIQNQLTAFLPRVRLISAEFNASSEQKEQNSLILKIRYLILGTTEVNSEIQLDENGYLNIGKERFNKVSSNFGESLGLQSKETRI